MTPPCPYCGEVLPHPPHTAGVSACGRIVTQPKENTVSESGVRRPTLDAMLDEIEARAKALQRTPTEDAIYNRTATFAIDAVEVTKDATRLVAALRCAMAGVYGLSEDIANCEDESEGPEGHRDPILATIAAILAGEKP